MFDEITKSYVKQAIEAETIAAVNNYGEKYNSAHEGYAVLKEKVDEARDEMIEVKNGLYNMWCKIRLDSSRKKEVESIREHAEKLALEAVQICAVCEKILKDN